MKIKNLISFLLYSKIGKDDFDSIRPMLWHRNIRALKITAIMSCGIGALFIIINLILQSGIWFPYLFLLCGSAVTLFALSILHLKNNKNETLRIVLCYAQIILICVYAGILSTQPSNYDTPATSVIVFIALLPLSIDDRPLRMYIVMLGETAAYLTVSYLLKSAQAFSLDLMNSLTFCIVGMVLYGIICVRNIREIHARVLKGYREA